MAKDRSAEIAAVLRRAEAIRWTNVKLAAEAQIHHVTISKAASTGRIGPSSLEKLELAVRRGERAYAKLAADPVASEVATL